MFLHLGRDVVWRAAEGLGDGVALHLLLAHAKVGDLDVPVLVEQDIVQLEVSVDDAAVVQVEQADGDLGGVEAGRDKVIVGDYLLLSEAASARASFWGSKVSKCQSRYLNQLFVCGTYAIART